MKCNIFLMALLCLQLNVFAHSPGFYIYYPNTGIAHGPYRMQINATADDFGPRALEKDNSKFQGGIDFNFY